MKIKANQILVRALAALCCAVPAAAQFNLSWHTIDGGGAILLEAPGGWQLSGTIGQPDAGLAMTGGGFEVVGGFWSGVSPARQCNDCVGDIDANGQVDLADLAVLLSHFGIAGGAICSGGDIEPLGGDGDVELGDLALLLSRFGTICP